METRYMLFILLMAPLISAAPEGFDEERGAAMDAALGNVICNNGFTIGQMEYLMSIADGYDSLQDNIDALEADEEALSELAEERDPEGFRDYMLNERAENALDARQAYVAARMEIWPTLTFEQRQELRSEYSTLLDEYQTCHYEALEGFANAKIEGYESALELASERMSNLSEKGVDTSELESLIDEAQDSVISPLKDEVASAEDGPKMREAIASYCLFDGCPNGENFHFAAKFETTKLGSVLDAMEEDAIEAGLGDEVEEASAHLGDAQESLDGVGTGRYPSGEGEEVWESIKDAADIIRDILGELRSA